MSSRILLVSFDLGTSKANDYTSAYKALSDAGLHRLSPHKDLRMPESTVIGTSDMEGSAAQLREKLKRLIEGAIEGEVSHLVVGIVSDWAVHGPPTELKTASFEELTALVWKSLDDMKKLGA